MNAEVSNWQRYIKVAVILSIIVIMGISGVVYNNHLKQKRNEEASATYESMLQAARLKDLKKTNEHAETLMQQYAQTPYATLAAVMLARMELDRKNMTKAIEYLQYALQHSEKGSLIEHIARVRLARVFASEDKFDEAMKLLAGKQEELEGYTTLYEEAKGDIYLKQNEIEKARASYLTALKSAPAGVPTTALQLKYGDLTENEKEGS